MNLRRFLIVGAFALSAIPASAQTVDGSTVESYERSVRAMVETLSEVDRAVFAKGMMNLIVTGYPAAAGVEGLALMSIMPAAVEAAHITLDGKSLEQIMERGRSLNAEALEATTSPAPDDPTVELIACLNSTVAISDAMVEDGDYSTNLSITVTNGLDWAISAVQFDYTIATPGRSVPWLKDNVSLSISGGIEPGEQRTVSTGLYGLSAEAIKPLEALVTLTDVADQDQRLLVGERRVMGWPEEPSSFECP